MPSHPAPFLFDIQGVLAWSRATGNERNIVASDIQQGDVLICNRVWNEFSKVYPDEAGTLSEYEFDRMRVTEEHRMVTAALAENANATFGRKGPYDQCIEWCVAGIASCGPYTIVTDARRKVSYEKIDGINAITYEEFLDLH